MAIQLTVTGNGHFQGSATNLTDYSVTEDATPIEGSDTTGGTGTLDFGVVEDPSSTGSILLLNNAVQLTDGSNGLTNGTVYSVSSTDGITKVSANSRVNALVANASAAPYSGTLGGALSYYFGLVGITSGLVIDGSLSLVKTNLIFDPRFTSIGNWNNRWFGGTGAGNYAAYDVPWYASGRAFYKTWTTAASGNGNTGFHYIGSGRSASPGVTYTVSGTLLPTVAGKTNASAKIEWYNAANAQISVSYGVTIDLINVGGGNFISVTAVAPAGTVTMLPVWDVDGGTPWQVNDQLVLLGPMVEASSTASSYFDGNNFPSPGAGNANTVWSGTPNNSTSVNARFVNYLNFSGSFWDYMKQLCVAQQIEISLVSGNVIVRPIRQRTAYMLKNSSVQLTVQNSGLAQAVESYSYNTNYQSNAICFPTGGDSTLISAYQVDIGKILTENIPVNVALQSLNQPTCVASNTLSVVYSGSTSVYSVSGQDGTPISPSVWIAAGGKITLAIGADGRSIDMSIIAPISSVIGNAPYIIGISNGPSKYYSALFIAGTGVFFTAQKLTSATGSPASKTANAIGSSVNNIFMQNVQDASSSLLATSQKWASPVQTITVTTSVANRPGDKGDQSYPTFANFDSSVTGTFASFDTTNSGQTFVQFNAAQQSLVANNFENQAFGNISGSRVLYRDAWYRIKTATITPSSISYTAEKDTIIADWNPLYAGKTFAQYDTKWSGKAFGDNAVIPLWT